MAGRGGRKIHQPNMNVAKIPSPSATPRDFFEITFQAEAGAAYHLWIRGRADNDQWSNDSIYVQFDGTITAPGGSPIYRIGTTSSLAWNLEECSGCGESGWGWEDNGWGVVNQLGADIYFAQTGSQRLRVQAREDGVAIDQIVLSAERYVRTRPGTAKNDATILARQ